VALSVSDSVTSANFTVTAETSDVTPYRFQRHGIINIRHDNVFTFIETDKPVFKPSDTGFRQSYANDNYKVQEMI